MNAQHEVDVGQEMTERGLSNAVVAWEQWHAERQALNDDYTARHKAARTCDEKWMVQMECSVEQIAWEKANPKPPEPPRRPIGKPELRLVPEWAKGSPRPYWGE